MMFSPSLPPASAFFLTIWKGRVVKMLCKYFDINNMLPEITDSDEILFLISHLHSKCLHEYLRSQPG